MTLPDGAPEGTGEYAVRIADDSYHWYRRAAIRSRRMFRTAEIATILISAAIPLVAVLSPGETLVPAILGSLVVVLTGLRGIYSWQENYLRFSGARESVEAERRRYHVGAEPYDNARTRDRRLVAAITRIEQEEMRGWVKIQATDRRGSGGSAVESDREKPELAGP